MAENSILDTSHDDDLGDEALDRSSGGKFKACSVSCHNCGLGRP
jgi:hypothetical protein